MTDRPPTVPADAGFDPKDQQWERGARGPNGEKLGPWTGWLPTGERAYEATYDDRGRLHGPLRRWHPNGELAQSATFEAGRAHGLYSWTRPSHGAADARSRLPPNAPDRVVRMDVAYHRGVVQPAHFTFHLTRDGEVPHDAQGRSIELAAHLHLVDEDTTLLPVAPRFSTTDGVELEPVDGDRWIYQGPTDGGFRVQRYRGRSSELFEVSPAELGRAFSLSAPTFAAWLEARRPDAAPEGAMYDAAQDLWELGAFDGVNRVGPWTTWRADGSLRARTTYVAGTLDGPFERFHPDGSVAWTGHHARGERVGALQWRRGPAETDEGHPGTLGDPVARVDRDLGTDEVRYSLADGAPCNVHGVPLRSAHRDHRFDLAPEAFLPAGFAAYLDDHHPRSEVELDEVLTGWLAYWGAPMHPELEGVVRELAAHGLPSLYEWRTELSIPCPDDDDQNWFADLIGEDLAHYEGWQLPQVFGGLFHLGTLWNGDSYHVSVFEPLHHPTGRGQVYRYDHEEGGFEAPFAIDLSRFTFFAALGDAIETTESVSPAGARRAMAQLEGQVRPSWHWRGTLARAGAEDLATYDSEAADSQYFWWMSRWIIALLRGDVDEAREAFDPNFFPAEGDWAPRMARIPREVPLGLYWMWRLYFFGDDARLDQVLEVGRASPARLLRDAARWCDAARSGGELGVDVDIAGVREAFQQLDLHPDRAAAREAAANEAAAADARAHERARAQVDAAAPEALEPLAWASLDDPHLMTALADRWRADPSMAGTWERVDAELGEVDRAAVLRGLRGAYDRRLVPLLVGTLRCGAPILRAREVLAALLPPEAAPELLPLLDRDDPYHHDHLAAVQVLAAARLRQAVPALIANLALRVTGVEGIAHRDYAQGSVRALGQIGGPEACVALGSLLRGPLAQHAAEAIAEVKAAGAFPALVEQLPLEPAAALLWAIAALADGVTPEERAEAAVRVAAVEPTEPHVWAVHAHATRALGGSAHDLNRWVRTALVSTSYSEEPSVANKVWALRVAALHDDVSIDELTPWARHEHPTLRDAARAAALRRGVSLAIVEQDVVSVRPWDEATCLAALRDPDVVGRAAVVGRLAELGGPVVGPALLAEVRRELAGHLPTHDGADAPPVLVAAVRALQEGGFDAEWVAACVACLEAGVRRLADPALRELPPAHPDLVTPIAAAERRESGWMARQATAWLDAYPDPDTVARARR
ncbi:MAG: hypothetical protein ABMA64_30390 [Myxococcota bacterium]